MKTINEKKRKVFDENYVLKPPTVIYIPISNPQLSVLVPVLLGQDPDVFTQTQSHADPSKLSARCTLLLAHLLDIKILE